MENRTEIEKTVVMFFMDRTWELFECCYDDLEDGGGTPAPMLRSMTAYARTFPIPPLAIAKACESFWNRMDMIQKA